MCGVLGLDLSGFRTIRPSGRYPVNYAPAARLKTIQISVGIYGLESNWTCGVDMSNKSICAMVFAGALAVAPLLAQDDAATQNDPCRLYTLCVAKIRNAPQEAYSPCKRYLEQTSDD